MTYSVLTSLLFWPLRVNEHPASTMYTSIVPIYRRRALECLHVMFVSCHKARGIEPLGSSYHLNHGHIVARVVKPETVCGMVSRRENKAYRPAQMLVWEGLIRFCFVYLD